MEPSFREILHRLMTSKKAETPSETVSNEKSETITTFYEPLNFAWESNLQRRVSQFPYPRPPLRVKKPKVQPKPPPPPELELLPKDLPPALMQDWKKLVAQGASEIQERLSLSRLTSAYRRLAKRLHPDALIGQSPETINAARARFVQVKQWRERLEKYLREKTNSKASGTEPASESKYPHQDAA